VEAQQTVTHYNNGLGQKPALGWSSWSALRKGGISDAVIRAQADVMHAQLQSHGYQYVNIDDGWFVALDTAVDANGRPTPDLSKFPNGIKPVADYVHSLGLKFGIYWVPGLPVAAYNQNTPILGTSNHARDISDGSTSGTQASFIPTYKINLGSAGSQAYIQSVADLFASWGVDYVKLDWVNVTVNLDYATAFSTALVNTHRPIWLQYSNLLQIQSPYGNPIASTANSWRNNPDVETYNGANPDGFNLPITDWQHVLGNYQGVLKRQLLLEDLNFSSLDGPGGWNDFDSLEMGWSLANTGLTAGEKQYMYSMWCIGSSPLLLGCDLRNIDAADLATLQNDEVIACDQAAFAPKYVHMGNQNWKYYWKPSGDGGAYVMLANALNPADPGNPGTITVNFADLGLSGSQSVRDLFTRTNLGTMSSYTANLAGHTSQLIKVGGTGQTNQPPTAPTGLVANAGNAQVVLNWSGSTGATSYNVYRGTSAGGESATAMATGITGNGYTSSNLSNGTTYYFVVKAVNAAGTSGASNEANATPSSTSTPYGGSPVQIAASGSTTIEAEKYDNGGEGVAYHDTEAAQNGGAAFRTTEGVDVYADAAASNGMGVGWTNGGEWMKYTVNVAATGSYTLGVRVSDTSSFTNALHVSDTNGTNLTGSINVQNTGGWTIYQTTSPVTVSLTAGTHVLQVYEDLGGFNIDSIVITAGSGGGPTIPAAPTGLTASPGNAQVSLSWSASSGATSYNLYRNGVKVKTAIASLSTVDTGLTNGTSYTYQVTAVNTAGESGLSGSVSGTPSAGSAPGAPSGLTASPGNAQVSLSWSASSGAATYSVFRGTTAGGESATAIATGLTGTSYTNIGLVNGTKYYFTVKAVNSAGTSTASNEASATPVANTSGIVLSGSASAGHVVTLSWTSTVPNVAYYTVYRGTSAGGEGTTPLDYPGSSPWQDNFAPVQGTKYYYVVRANDIYGNTIGPSNEVSVTP